MTLTCNRLKEAGDRDVLPPFTRSCRTSIALSNAIDGIRLVFGGWRGSMSSLSGNDEEAIFSRLPIMEQMDCK
jgi:hypothetical protein